MSETQSRLDLFIDRMVSQRASLDFAIAETAGLGGPVFELGLGNGRTYHHMVHRIRNRPILFSSALSPRIRIRRLPTIN